MRRKRRKTFNAMLEREKARLSSFSRALEKEDKPLGEELRDDEWGPADSPWLRALHTKKQKAAHGQQSAELSGEEDEEDGVFSVTSAHFRPAGPRPRIPWTPGCWMSENAGGAGGSSSSSLAPQLPGSPGPPLDAHAIAQLMVRLSRRSDAPPHPSDAVHRVALMELLRTRRSPEYRAYRASLLEQEQAPRPRECMDVSAETLQALSRERPVSRRGAPSVTAEEMKEKGEAWERHAAEVARALQEADGSSSSDGEGGEEGREEGGEDSEEDVPGSSQGSNKGQPG